MDIAPSVSISTADFCIAFQNAARGATLFWICCHLGKQSTALGLDSVHSFPILSAVLLLLISLIYLSPGLLLIAFWLLSVPKTAQTQSDLLT